MVCEKASCLPECSTLRYLMINPAFMNRELSWLKFNERVLEEAQKARNPLFERLRFISITASNLDEFYMIRVGSLFDQLIVQTKAPDNKTNMSLEDQLKAIFKQTKTHYIHRDEMYTQVLALLKTAHIKALEINQLTTLEYELLKGIFDKEILPLLSAYTIDGKHPFPHLNNKKTYVMVRFEDKGHIKEGLISYQDDRLPSVLTLPLNKSFKFILLEDVIVLFAQSLFRGNLIERCAIRLTRNADLDAEEAYNNEDVDYRDFVKALLKKRNRLNPVRLEYRYSISKSFMEWLCDKIDIDTKQVFELQSPLTFMFISPMEQYLKQFYPDFFYPRIKPALTPLFERQQAIIPQILDHDIFYQHPYQSMEPYLALLKEASMDPKVSTIKITLYRVASDSRILHDLIQAAENQKEVLVVMELKARFDEANNIAWSQKLEEAGCRVIYGVDKLKVHSKITIFVRHDKGKIQTITHLSTGNYNEKTARLYTDANLITAHEGIGQDAITYFNELQSNQVDESFSSRFKHLWVSPFGIQQSLISLIDAEIQSHLIHGNGHLILKMNSLTDVQILNALIEASKAGVTIDLIVRGICCLVPQVKGLSDNIRVTSIVGRFLEHSRIFMAYQNAKPQFYISSADLMTRNMSKRLEIAVPIFDLTLQNNLIEYLDLCLNDTANSRIMNAKQEYTHRKSDPLVDSHQLMLEWANGIEFDASQTKHPKKKPAFESFNFWLSRILTRKP